MNTQHLKYFIRVCDCGSFAAAANELYLSRQSLTSAINALEADMGDVKLLVRKSTGVEPTKAGKFFYDRATALISSIDDTVDRLAQMSENSEISVGAPMFCLTEQDVTDILSFERDHSLGVICRDLTYNNSRKCLLDGSLDVGMVYKSPEDIKLLRYAFVADADFCILGRDDSAINAMDEVGFEDIQGANFLFVYGLNFISAELEKQLIKNNIHIQCIPRNRSVLISSLKAGKGYHILPRLFSDSLCCDGIIKRPFRMFSSSRQLCFACIKDASDTIVALMRHAASVVSSLAK